ncbi:MAG: PQQ-binding-like beta-propeller repeat protein [Thermoguttaceae bacterium]|jgi:outer membrane protein assembly factor BamB
MRISLAFGATAFGLVAMLAGEAVSGQPVAFRGDWTGRSEATKLPTTWNETTNLVWKSALPGPGSSIPIVVNGRIYLTCYTGYAESIEEPGEMAGLVRHVLCLDRKSGKILWQKSFKARMPESEYRGSNNTRHGYASSTPTSDGQFLYIFFGASGVFCLDLDGNQVWHADVGTGIHDWGSATSPLLYRDLVIINASIESNSLVGLDKKTGKEVWRAGGISSCWASPVLVDTDEGKQEIVLNVPNTLTGYDPQTGEKLWYCEGIPDGYLCPSVIGEGNVAYAIGARKNSAMAVRTGGRGDVTESHVLWRTNKGSNVSSPVYVDGYLYWFHESRGTAICVNAKTGEVVFEERLEPRAGLIYASVLAADGKLYGLSQNNGTYVLAARPEFQQLAVNVFADDNSRANASPVVSEGQILLRTDKALYCLGK